MELWHAAVAENAHNALGEGPCWDERNQTLYWLDIFGRKMYAMQDGAIQEYALPVLMGTLALCKNPRRLVMAGEGGVYFYDLEKRALLPVVDPEPEIPGHRFNDGKCGPDGRFWAGGVRLQGCEHAPDCKFYCMEANGQIREVFGQVQVSNGLAWSLNKETLYYIDSFFHKVWAFDFDATQGLVSNRRAVVEFAPGIAEPDGMTIDSEGMLWVAMWEDWCVLRCNPATGEIIGRVEVDAPLTSCPTFGGPELDILYITTASSISFKKVTRSANEGALFAVKTGYQGLPSNLFLEE